jgi:hypothetical protein
MLFQREHLRASATPDEKHQRLPANPIIGTGGQAAFLVGKRGADLAQLIPELPPFWSGDIITDGHWSLHELIGYLMRHTGSAEVWLTSWGISTEPLQAILDMVRGGLITKLNLILNHRVVQGAPQAYQLLRALHDDARVSISLAKIHAKLVVIHNELHELRIVTSANLTNNPRIENYNISTHREHALSTRAILDLVMQGAQPFKPA